MKSRSLAKGEPLTKKEKVETYIKYIASKGVDKVKRDDFVNDLINNESFYLNYDYFHENSKNYWFFLLHTAYISRDPRRLGQMKRRVAKLYNKKMSKQWKIRY